MAPSTTEVLRLLAEVVAKHGEETGTKALKCFQDVFAVLDAQAPNVRDATLELLIRSFELAKRE